MKKLSYGRVLKFSIYWAEGNFPRMPLGFTLNSAGLFYFFKEFYLFIFRERGGEKEWERNISVWLPLVCPLLGTWPAAQACVLTGNQTSDLLVHRLVLSPLSHTGQGSGLLLIGCS